MYWGRNIDVSSAKSLTVDFTLSDKTLMYLRENKEPSIDPCGTPALTSVQEDA